jgi:putative Mg2+ transporter-C (MgtC) family protein
MLTVVVLGASGGQPHVDALSRVIQGIIAGVGFLGGGAILKSSGTNEQEAVHGLTTAASIWVVASLGIACGTGQWPAAMFGAALTIIVLILGGGIDRAIKKLRD